MYRQAPPVLVCLGGCLLSTFINSAKRQNDSRQRGLNSRPTPYEGAATTTELCRRMYFPVFLGDINTLHIDGVAAFLRYYPHYTRHNQHAYFAVSWLRTSTYQVWLLRVCMHSMHSTSDNHVALTANHDEYRQKAKTVTLQNIPGGSVLLLCGGWVWETC